MPKGRIENLKPFTSQQDREKARENGRKGGLAWARIRRDRRQREEEEIAKKLLRPWDWALEKSTFGRLRLRQQRFLLAFMIYGNAAQAAREAGYKIKWARCTGCRLLHRTDVQEGLRCLWLHTLRERDPAKYPGHRE